MAQPESEGRGYPGHNPPCPMTKPDLKHPYNILNKIPNICKAITKIWIKPPRPHVRSSDKTEYLLFRFEATGSVQPETWQRGTDPWGPKKTGKKSFCQLKENPNAQRFKKKITVKVRELTLWKVLATELRHLIFLNILWRKNRPTVILETGCFDNIDLAVPCSHC